MEKIKWLKIAHYQRDKNKHSKDKDTQHILPNQKLKESRHINKQEYPLMQQKFKEYSKKKKKIT